jgi:hypothetical protein
MTPFSYIFRPPPSVAMQIALTVRNYRCRSDTNPATISLRAGLTPFVGVNNSGKTTLLRFFYEFR